MNNISSKFAIIGVSSFSGSWLCKHLLSNGHQVLGFGRKLNQNECFLPYTWIKNERCYLKEVDINTDTHSIFKSLCEFKPKFIINFVAQGMVAESWEKPEDWFQTNVLSQIKLLEKLKDLNFIEKYINFSTPEVYGNTKNWITENYNFQPSTPYATSRASFDMHLKTYFDHLDFPAIITRTSNVFGPGQQLYRILPRAILAARGIARLELHGNGVSKRNFIDIRDVAKALEMICFKGDIGKTYHISGKTLTSIKSLVKKVAQYFRVDIGDIIEIANERLGKDANYSLDSQLLRDSLNWNEDFKMDDTIQETIEWIEKYENDIRNMSFNYEHRS